MPKPTDIRLLEVTSETEQFNYRTPIKFGGRVVSDVVLLHVKAEVETRRPPRRGFRSMPVSPTSGDGRASPASSDQTLAAMTAARPPAGGAGGDCQAVGHPGNHPSWPPATRDRRRNHLRPRASNRCRGWPNSSRPAPGSRHPRRLRQGPGRKFVQPAFRRVRQSRHRQLSDRAVRRRVSRSIHVAEAKALDAALPPRRDARSVDRWRHRALNDGLPETLPGTGSRSTGYDASEDQAQRRQSPVGRGSGGVGRAGRSRGPGRTGLPKWCYSGPTSTRSALQRPIRAGFPRPGPVNSRPRQLSDCITSSSRPTCDLKANPDNRMHEAAKIKPVVIDESLVDFEPGSKSRRWAIRGRGERRARAHRGQL